MIRCYLLFILVISTVVIAPWLTIGTPKLLLVATPIILTVSAAGFITVYGLQNQSFRRVPLAALAVIGLLPWFVGVEARFGDTAWGPGFELQDFDRPSHEGSEFRPLFLSSGAAVPTSEGPRALFSHFASIFGGGWRTLIQTQNAEIMTAVDAAIEHDVPLYVFDDSEGYFIAALLRAGFVTSDPESSVQRVFTHPDGTSLTLIEPIVETIGVFEGTQSVRAIIVGEPATLRGWYLMMPNALEKIGARTAIFNASGTP